MCKGFCQYMTKSSSVIVVVVVIVVDVFVVDVSAVVVTVVDFSVVVVPVVDVSVVVLTVVDVSVVVSISGMVLATSIHPTGALPVADEHKKNIVSSCSIHLIINSLEIFLQVFSTVKSCK